MVVKLPAVPAAPDSLPSSENECGRAMKVLPGHHYVSRGKELYFTQIICNQGSRILTQWTASFAQGYERSTMSCQSQRQNMKGGEFIDLPRSVAVLTAGGAYDGREPRACHSPGKSH